jgi:hypothetical protein
MGYPSYNRDLSKLQSKDLDRLRDELVREQMIRQVMAETGESREIVAEMADAADSMGQEAVTVLTDGDPTTLHDALSRYVDGQMSLLNDDPNDEEARTWAEVVGALSAILAYPYPDSTPEPAVVVTEDPDVTRLLVSVTWRAPSGEFYYRPYERVDRLKRWISSALDDRDDGPEPEFEDVGARDVEMVRKFAEPAAPAGPPCGHGAALVKETPSVFEGAPPIRDHADGCQAYGPYADE